ncbi:hypothetical protein ONS95_001283 [Cadophora gregata]|uniref:uncharacterized protein n=1 Tax=Cadophora gregata TaxID=51156 RepID=UPI0026DA9543|nr:uncharacterized protein ONS95_001283 [Cadophora gregata]KAK0101905.1 hypothetical protein ONS96_005879 [Cadophora gregata f. sp. sojae]KAK0129356.1 hypothetical protein ONS95_001283 [Cadophora gregata]
MQFTAALALALMSITSVAAAPAPAPNPINLMITISPESPEAIFALNNAAGSCIGIGGTSLSTVLAILNGAAKTRPTSHAAKGRMAATSRAVAAKGVVGTALRSRHARVRGILDARYLPIKLSFERIDS